MRNSKEVEEKKMRRSCVCVSVEKRDQFLSKEHLKQNVIYLYIWVRLCGECRNESNSIDSFKKSQINGREIYAN